jgi:hypothetical protein
MQQRYARYAMYVGSVVFFIVLVYFALLADAFYSGGDQQFTAQSAQIVPSLPIDLAPGGGEKEEVTVAKPQNGWKSPSRAITVEGKAPLGAEVVLFVNGKLLDRLESQDSSYRFIDVPLPQYANVIQTRFNTKDGSSASSNAIMVFCQNANSEK